MTDQERAIKAQLYQLATLVGEMRAKQNEYFAKRERGVLAQAKKLERQVDEAVREIVTAWIHDPLHFD